MVNTEIRKFRDTIIAMTNSCQLPVEIKRLVFAELMTSLSNAADNVIKEEQAQEKSKGENANE